MAQKTIPAAPRATRSAFLVSAKQISRDIYATQEKLEKLAKRTYTLLLFFSYLQCFSCESVASSTSLFNDPVHDIQELTYMIKKDIAALNQKLESVKTMSSKSNKQSQQNSENVVGNLSLKLQGATKQFRTVLATRSEVRQSEPFNRELTNAHLDRTIRSSRSPESSSQGSTISPTERATWEALSISLLVKVK